MIRYVIAYSTYTWNCFIRWTKTIIKLHEIVSTL